jgi:hypothetical protein
MLELGHDCFGMIAAEKVKDMIGSIDGGEGSTA